MSKRAPFIQIILVGVAVTLLSLLYFFYPATAHSFHPVCPFHALTGWYCPGCGSQRSVSALLHGDVLMALKKNSLLVISLPFIIYSAIVFIWNAFNDTNKMEQRVFYSPSFIKIVLLIVIVFAVMRNIPSYPFTILAPG